MNRMMRNLSALLVVGMVVVAAIVMRGGGGGEEEGIRSAQQGRTVVHEPKAGDLHPHLGEEESGKGGTILVSEFLPPEPEVIAADQDLLITGFEGNLLDPDGDPIEGAEIAIVPKLVQDGQTHRIPWSTEVFTDRNGRFLITADLRDAAVTGGQVVLTCEGGTPQKILYFSKRIEMIRGEIVDLGDLLVGSIGASFVATVRDEAGRPIPGAGVRFLFPTGSVSGVTASTNEHGKAEVVGIACYGDTEPDHFRCFLEHPSWLFPGKVVKVDPDRTKAYLPGGAIDFVVRLEEPEPEFNFAILDYKGPPKERRIHGAVVIRDGYVVDQSYVPFEWYDTFSALPIRVAIKDVPARTFAVEVYACDGSGEFLEANLSSQSYQSMPVLMGSASRWKRGVEARGRLLAADGSPIAERYVMLQPKASDRLDGPRYREARSNSEGVFVFHALPPGKELVLIGSGVNGRVLHSFSVPTDTPTLELPDLSVSK